LLTKHGHRNLKIYYLLLFCGSDSDANAPQYYIIRAWPVLFRNSGKHTDTVKVHLAVWY